MSFFSNQILKVSWCKFKNKVADICNDDGNIENNINEVKKLHDQYRRSIPAHLIHLHCRYSGIATSFQTPHQVSECIAPSIVLGILRLWT